MQLKAAHTTHAAYVMEATINHHMTERTNVPRRPCLPVDNAIASAFHP